MCENGVGVIMLRDETEVHGEKPITMPLQQPQLTYGMTWRRKRFYSMRGECVITRTMAGLVCLLDNVVLIHQSRENQPPPPLPQHRSL